ncbi:MAG: cytochrome c [Phaeospirillum sp.]|nr:cytochrome c [Phaeospirillum sp.]
MKKKINQTAVLAGILVIGVVASAIAGDALAQAAGQWRDANHVYSKICANCHEIGVGPVIKGRNLDPDYYQSVVRHGMRAMPAFRPTDVDDAMLKQVGEMLSKSPAPGGSK